MGQARINAGGIPLFKGDLVALQTAATGMISDASAITTAGADVTASWQGLSTAYSSPDSATLLLALTAVPGLTSGFGTDLTAVGKALQTFVTEMLPIQAALAKVKVNADAFITRTNGDNDWDHDQSKVDENNGYIRQVNSLVVQQEAAERKCANAIEALFHGRQWHSHTASTPANDQNAYGYDSIPDNSGAPWGSTAHREDSCPKAAFVDIGHFCEGVWDGAKGMVVGLGDLVGVQGWEKMKQSWEGLGQLAIVIGPLIGNPTALFLYGPKGELDRLVALGKGLIGYDAWGKGDNARALGTSVFNIGSLLIPVGGEVAAGGDAAKVAKISADAADTANAASKTAQALDFTKSAVKLTLKATFDPVSLVPFEKLPGISDLTNALKDHFGSSIDTTGINNLNHTGPLDTAGGVPKTLDNNPVTGIHGTGDFNTPVNPAHFDNAAPHSGTGLDSSHGAVAGGSSESGASHTVASGSPGDTPTGSIGQHPTAADAGAPHPPAGDEPQVAHATEDPSKPDWDAELAKLTGSDKPDALVGAHTPATDAAAVGHGTPDPAVSVGRDTSEHSIADTGSNADHSVDGMSGQTAHDGVTASSETTPHLSGNDAPIRDTTGTGGGQFDHGSSHPADNGTTAPGHGSGPHDISHGGNSDAFSGPHSPDHSTTAHDSHVGENTHDSVTGHETPASEWGGLGHDPAIPHTDPRLLGHDLTPEEIRKHPDTGNQTNGDWVGQNGQKLNPLDNQLAQHYAAEAATARGTLQPHVLEEVGKVLPGHPFQGLDESVKYANSLKGKIATEMMARPKLTAADALAEVHDSIRFTVEIPPTDYTSSVNQIVDGFHERGWKVVKDAWNAWPGPGYRGLNTRWIDPSTGKVFEVQFHTAESFFKKSTEHGGYEELRLPNLPPGREAELTRLSHEHYADVEIPPGAETLELKKETDPPKTWSPR